MDVTSAINTVMPCTAHLVEAVLASVLILGPQALRRQGADRDRGPHITPMTVVLGPMRTFSQAQAHRHPVAHKRWLAVVVELAPQWVMATSLGAYMLQMRRHSTMKSVNSCVACAMQAI